MKEKISILTQHISITSIDEESTQKAIQNLNVYDLENGIAYCSAMNSHCVAITTKDKNDFHFSKIPFY